jgi:uncharacterized protein YbcC (UPF0753/DUF2309 family)
MPLTIPKEGATQEEINAWIVDTQEKYNTMETDLNNKTKREQELIDYNNKLFAKVTSKKEDKQDDTDKGEIPFCIDEETFKKLNEKDIAELIELMEGEDE